MTNYERWQVQEALKVRIAQRPRPQAKEVAESRRQWQLGREWEEREYQAAMREARTLAYPATQHALALLDAAGSMQQWAGGAK